MPATRLASSTTACCSGRAGAARPSRGSGGGVPASTRRRRGPPPPAAKGFGAPPAAPPAPPPVQPPPVDGEPMRVSMVSLGCPKNTVDGAWRGVFFVRRTSCMRGRQRAWLAPPQPPLTTTTHPLPHRTGEVLLGDFAAHGFSIVDDHATADAIVVNTCAFVEDAKAESLDAILEAAALKAGGGGGDGSSSSRPKRVVVTGCLAQRYAGELAASLPEADLVVGFEGYAGLPAALRESLGGAPLVPGAAKAPTPARVRVGSPTVPFRGEAVRHRLTPRHTAYLRVAEGCSHKCTFCAIPGFR
jgi:hypothetical protein